MAAEVPSRSFASGTLRQLSQRATARALACGALLPLSSTVEVVEDTGVPFQVRKLTGLEQKDRARQASESQTSGSANPFLPYERELYVADVNTTHVCLLNKFSVVNDHLLLVTRHFEHQQSQLTRADFKALWRCAAEYKSIFFYNAGPQAGASQTHRHWQMLPLLSTNGTSVPLDPRHRPPADRYLDSRVWPPYRHAWAPLSLADDTPAPAAAQVLYATYCGLADSLGLCFEADPLPAYNLLVTREWMLIVPRVCEFFHSISLNSLAFVGALLVRDDQQLARLRASGPMTALCRVAGFADNS